MNSWAARMWLPSLFLVAMCQPHSVSSPRIVLCDKRGGFSMRRQSIRGFCGSNNTTITYDPKGGTNCTN